MNKKNKNDFHSTRGEELNLMDELECILRERKLELELEFNSDCEVEEVTRSGKNSFTLDVSESNDNDEEYKPEEEINIDTSQAEHKMNALLRGLESHVAIPDYALTDAVFCVDKPKCSISLGEKLPLLDLAEYCHEDAVIQISVTEVYSPFQIWFQLSEFFNTLNILTNNLCDFYNQSNRDMNNYLSHLPNYFIQPGYICAARYGPNKSWCRVRIVSQPLSEKDNVSIYYVDYGSGAEVTRTDLRFLHRNFAILPPLAIRGCLSYIHPLGSHWSWDTIQEFKHLVLDQDLYANVTECDFNESVVFMRLSYNKNLKPSINRLMVEADLAGKSDHYSKRMRKFNCGRRLKYLRERLPSFEMLETRVYPIWNEDFENDFDNLICAPSFFDLYEVPNLKNPLLCNLQKALDSWMISYKKEEEIWRKLQSKIKKEKMMISDNAIV